jgi:hypothetical protein
MTNEEMVLQLSTAIAMTTNVRDALRVTPPEPEPPAVIDVTPGNSLQTAIDSADVGSTLRLAPGTYEGAVVINKSLHFVPLNPPPNGPAGRDQSVWLTSSAEETVKILPTADDVSFLGIGYRNSNAQYEWVHIQGTRVLFDRCTGLGDPTHGQHRGWRPEGQEIQFVHCYADDVFLFGRESCVIGSWQDLDGLNVDRCFFRGGAETIMFGGGDAPAADRIPRNIRITSSTLTKNPQWYAMGAQLKNPFELKCAINVYVGDCLMEYGGVAEGQSAYLCVLTVRNQDGYAPWSTIQDVLIERCLFRYGGGGVNILGADDQQASVTMSNVTLRDCRFTDMNPQGLWSQGGYYGSGRGVQFDRAPHAVTMDGITMEGLGMGALGYFMQPPHQPTQLTLRNWKYFTSEYGWKIDSGGQDQPPASANIQALMPDLTYEITANDPGAAVGRSARQWAN